MSLPSEAQAVRHPKILFLDIETLPNVSYTWGKYEQNVIAFERERCLATFAAKWSDGEVFAKALPDYWSYKPGSYDDKGICADLWKLLDDADVVVAHNGDQFDVRVINARFIVNGLGPPSPYKTVDTKKVAKRAAFFNSNKLDDIGQLLGLGKKIKTDFDLWLGCIGGNLESWAQMVAYNKQDVLLLESVYKKLLPWAKNHPNLTMLSADAVCPKCGSSDVQFRGFAITQTRRYRRFQCRICAGWGRETNGHSGTAHTNAT